MAAAAAVFAALSASRFPLAIKMHEQLAVPAEGHTKEIAPMLLVHCAACVAAAAVLCVMFGLPDLVGAANAAAAGFVAITAGLLTRSLGCLLATDLSVNAISFATPLVAFVLFSVAGAAAGRRHADDRRSGGADRRFQHGAGVDHPPRTMTGAAATTDRRRRAPLRCAARFARR